MQKQERDVARKIGDEVRRLRKARGWSQAVLAERIDLSLNYVSLIECADRLPSVEVLIRLAAVLAVPLRDLLTEDPSGTPPAEQGDPWLLEAVTLLGALPDDARPLALGVLRGMAEAARTERSGVRPKRRRTGR